MDYIGKIPNILEQRKSIKPLLNKLYEQTGAFEAQQKRIENILKEIKEYQTIYDNKKKQAERWKENFNEKHYQSLIDKRINELLSCIKKLVIVYSIDNSNEEKEKFAKILFNSIYLSNDVCGIPTKFEIRGVGVFDVDLEFEREEGYRVSMININLILILGGNQKDIDLGNYYFDDDDKKQFSSEIETREIVDLINELIEQKKQNLKYVSASQIADVIRKYLSNKNISFKEDKAVTTNTIYFIVNNMKIRVSDHEKVSNPSKMFTTSDPFFMERYQKAQERDSPSFDFVAGKYPNGEEYFNFENSI